MDRILIEKVQKLRNEGKSFGEISKELLITKSSACYCNKIDLDEYDKKKALKKGYEEKVCEIAKRAKNFNQLCKVLGKHPTNETIRLLKNVLDKNNVDYSHFVSEPDKHNNFQKKRDINEFLVSGKTTSITHLKDRLLNEGLKEYKCERCGRSEWEGEQIPLQLHHINGDRTDNRLENLQVLCPNCHALTDNYCSKKIKKEKKYCPVCGKEMCKTSKLCKDCFQKVFRNKKVNLVYDNKEINIEKIKDIKYKLQSKCPPKEELLEKFREYGSFKSVGEYYEVSDNAVRKWCTKYLLPVKCREMREYIKNKFDNEINWKFLKTNDALSGYQELKYPKRCLIGYDGKIEKIYSSGQELKDDGYTPKHVLSVCKGILKTHHHRVFKFYDEINAELG